MTESTSQGKLLMATSLLWEFLNELASFMSSGLLQIHYRQPVVTKSIPTHPGNRVVHWENGFVSPSSKK